jgi:hypothetical protein
LTNVGEAPDDIVPSFPQGWDPHFADIWREGAWALSTKDEFMASSVWSGYLTFGLISMPVRLFSGARGSHISFHMLHRDDNTRIKQQLWCPHDERVVERSEIVKGYE